MKYYYQCMLSHTTEDGEVHITLGWIEERGAKKEAEVEMHGEWWRVIEVYPTPMTEEALHIKQKADRNAFASLDKQR